MFKYNIMVSNKQYSNNETYQIKMNKNATNIEHIQSWLHDTSFNHISKIAIGALVMFIENISILKGTMNGNIAI
jgi:spore coat protein CotF